MNSALFERMMQAGSYFLHLREFADTMSAGGLDEGPGKVLQSFALAVGEFLQEYQAQVIEFGNQVRRRRLAEGTLVEGVDVYGEVTLLEVIVHLEPLIDKLNLLANICFTQKFINNILRIEQEEEINELGAENEAFQALLYEAGVENKFTKANLRAEFEANLERIRQNQWLEEFPRGAHLLSYLYKILMCCESDLQAVDMLRRIFSRTFEPMVEMIASFVYGGDFNDPFGEFFIVKN